MLLEWTESANAHGNVYAAMPPDVPLFGEH